MRPAFEALGIADEPDDPFGPSGGSTLLLSVDSQLHPLPWEATASLRRRTVARVLAFNPSPTARGSGEETRAVINPSGDLRATETALAPLVSRLLAPARVCTDAAEASAALSTWLASSRAYVYAGHGAGERLVPPAKLASLPTSPCPAMLLGCASGRLQLRRGPLFPLSRIPRSPDAVLPALMRAGCPAAAAVLWDVTDRDLDAVSAALMEAVAGASGVLDVRAAAALRRARERCTLPLANGAAVVLFVAL